VVLKEQQRIEITPIETIADKVIPTRNSWKLNDDIKRAAEFALIHVPYRKAAKHAYFDMLRRQMTPATKTRDGDFKETVNRE